MPPKPSHILSFIKSIIQGPAGSVVECDNWIDDGELVAASFTNLSQPDALFVLACGSSFVIKQQLLGLEPKFDLLVVLVKQEGILDESVPFIAQIQVVNIPLTKLPTDNEESNDSYEQLKNLISLAITPYFDFIALENSLDAPNSNSLSIAKKRFQELSLSLKHLKHRLDVPDLLLTVPSKLMETLINQDAVHDSVILSDTSILNDLTKTVNLWIRLIQYVTQITKGSVIGESLQDEVQFWSLLETALVSIHEQTKQPAVINAIDILNAAKRFQVSLAFQNNLGILEKLEETQTYTTLLKDLPISDLVFNKDNIPSVPQFEKTITTFFTHLKKWKSLSSIPLRGMIELVEVLLKEFAQYLCELVTHANSAVDSDNDFHQLYQLELPELFSTIDNNVKFMVNVIRELMRKRQEKFMAVKIELPLLTQLRERIEDIKSIRNKFSELLFALHRFEGNEKHIEAIALAYNKHIALSSPCDFSNEGLSMWKTNQQSYLDVHLSIQDSVRSIINRNFESCQKFTDYYYLLRKLQGDDLNDSSTIMNLYIDEKHKLNILDVAYEDIHNLIDLYDVDGSGTNELNLCQTICREDSLRQKLLFYIANLEIFLGENWKRYSVGAKIESEANAQFKTLDSQNNFSNWKHEAFETLTSDSVLENTLVVENPVDGGDAVVRVNYDVKKFAVIYETKKLLALGYNMPSRIMIQVERTKSLKPLVLSLVEHIQSLTEIIELRNEAPFGIKFGFLVEDQVKLIFSTLKMVTNLTWSQISSEIKLHDADEALFNSMSLENSSVNCISMLQNLIHSLHVQMNSLQLVYTHLVEDAYPQIMACSFSHEAISHIIGDIQQRVSVVTRSDLCDLSRFVNIVNEDILKVLCQKCTLELSNLGKLMGPTVSSDSQDVSITNKLPLTYHELTYNDTEITITPALEVSKLQLVSFVNETLKVISSQKLISLRGEIGQFELLDEPSLSLEVSATLSAIDEQHRLAKAYLDQWLEIEVQLRTSFSLEDYFKSRPLLDGIVSLHTEITKLTEHRKLMNDGTGIKVMGLIRISFLHMQLKVQTLFLQSLIRTLNSFSEKIKEIVTKVSSELSSAQSLLLENLNFEASPTSVLKRVSDVFTLQRKEPEWRKVIQALFKCQLSLLKMRLSLPEDWIHVEQLESQLDNISSILGRKQEKITTNIESLKLICDAEFSRICEDSDKLELEWSQKKPISSSLEPPSALAVLARFQSLVNKISLQLKPLIDLRQLLDFSPDKDVSISSIEDELKELKFVWATLQDLWAMLETVKKQKWADENPRSLKQNLESILLELKKCPISVRQYSAFESLQGLIKQTLKDFGLISDLKSDSVKDRHLELIMDIAGSRKKKSSALVVGDVIGINFRMHEPSIRSVLEQAHSEQLILSTLEGIAQEWSIIVFELFSYNGKCRLVKNWKALYDQCETNLSTLRSIENSNLHSHLDGERQDLESRLNDFKAVLDIWVEVQRQWIYLDGVFLPHSQIKASLPLEATRFNNISIEFMSLNKKLINCKAALDILSIKGCYAAMSKISESLNKTVKGLTEFLDKQRQQFARLFFIGNEDFLELLGSGTNSSSINKHIKLMFAGIKAIIFDSNSSQIVGFESPQGEVVNLVTPISLIEFREVTSWLKVFEYEMKLTLSDRICKAVVDVQNLDFSADAFESIMGLLKLYPAQALIVAFQVYFSEELTKAHKNNAYTSGINYYDAAIKCLTELASTSVDALNVSKLRSLLVEVLFYKETIQSMSQADPSERISILNSQLLYRCKAGSKDPLDRICIVQGRSVFKYGFEYQGVTERLAVTPLVTDCFLAMTQGLAQKQGGSPFGPAGTGKTECIKALGHNFGRMVLVFNCDDSFDFQSMGRILLGLCQVGCWGCFDEFNRLETNILSTLSSQVESIEYGLRSSEKVAVSGKEIQVNENTGVFITMNPGYAGRNELPENLKKHFRGFSMDRPDGLKIAHVLLSSYGFVHSEEVASKAIPFFSELRENVTKQLHYDFGLRALKTVLKRAGYMRKRVQTVHEPSLRTQELSIFSSCLDETVLPQLVESDCTLFQRFKVNYFGTSPKTSEDDDNFKQLIQKHASLKGLDASDELLKKAEQLHKIQQSNHGFMLVGKSGSGKSTTLNLVLDALGDIDNSRCEKLIIDSKVISKETLFGSLDAITRDWHDGLFTRFLRGILANLKGEKLRRTWIIFDGDVDPEWAENLNSLLDDNKILTLPNGERLELPDNVKIVFEVSSLEFVTPATVSRCGMIWFDLSAITSSSIWKHKLHHLGETIKASQESSDVFQDKAWSGIAAAALSFEREASLDQIGKFASEIYHIMDFNNSYAIASVFTYFHIHCSRLLANFAEDVVDVEVFAKKALFLSFIWGYAGDSDYAGRESLRELISSIPYFADVEAPRDITLTRLSLPETKWKSWSDEVESADLEPHEVLDPGIIVPTVDTVIHENLVHQIVNKHSPLILCGPPGSGKTMTLLKALRDSPDLDAAPINFSKDTTPEVLLATLEQHCEYRNSSAGIVLAPKIVGKWVVVFCDEINLPSTDKYGTQRVISFMRQLIEHGGFWRAKDLKWVSLDKIQFVGACNDPKDPGRNQLDDRFLRHSTVVMVDYPGPESMKTIYLTFNSAILKCAPDVRSFANELTESMLNVYEQTKTRLNTAKMSHYIYSPRELTRWCRGILETVMTVTYRDVLELIRLWYHEGLRLFYDRLVDTEDKLWCKNLFKEVASQTFPNTDLSTAMQEPVLYSRWISGEYESVGEDVLRKFMKERLRVFSEEESEVDLILFGDMLDHALRIDRVLRQHQGHMILVGPDTSGKSTLTKFVAWMNGLILVQLRTHTGFTVKEFEVTLREVLLRCAKGEQICFLIDESSIIETSFIERMNTLLANSEIPGLFEGEDLDNLNKLCAAESASLGTILDTDDELHEWFVRQISENLHVVFTMSGFENEKNPQITSSPALFNRCVISWMGDWDVSSLFKICDNFIRDIPFDQSTYVAPSSLVSFSDRQPNNLKDCMIDLFSWIHAATLKETWGETFPKQFLDFNKLFVKLYTKYLNELEENQRHTVAGLDKLRETVFQVSEMKKSLSEKKVNLQNKDDEAKQMLNKMIVDQNEAERKREFSVAAQIELEKQEVEINTRRSQAMQELELAEPAVLEAQRGVQNIKKQHLTEMRSMANPPAAIKMAMESVCVLLGYKVPTWRDVQLIVRKDDFIYSIVTFDSETHLTPERRKYMESTYLSRPDYNHETIDRASKACGPLFLWVTAQLKYSTILENIGPLREEVDMLEASANKSRAHLIAIAEMIEELAQSIEVYKNDYSELIRDTEKIKSEMSLIEMKVARSMRLIENLTKERKRWQASVETFQLGREKLVGNAIIGSAFAVYCGDLSQGVREKVLRDWKEKLTESGIKYDSSLAVSSLLSSTDAQARWSAAGLLSDILFVDNFAISAWSEVNYIVDPSGSIPDILMRAIHPSKLIVTSFLSNQLVKVVEDALRFGGTVLIQNAEAYDSILDPVIRNEVLRMGGRKTIAFGGKSLVLLEDFKLILFTKDSKLRLLSFLKSRTRVLNFSITRSNIENRILDLSLEHSKPELFVQKNEIVSLQSIYHVRLLELRQQLLIALSDVKGKILDNDDLIESLESLESESSEIDEKLSDSEEVMVTVENSRSMFATIASHVKNIYDILMFFSKKDPFYNFPLDNIIDMFVEVFRNRKTRDSVELATILYRQVRAIFAPTLKRLDKLSFEVCLVTSFHGVEIGERLIGTYSNLLSAIYDGTLQENLPAILQLFMPRIKDGDLKNVWMSVKEVKDDLCARVLGDFIEKTCFSTLDLNLAFIAFIQTLFDPREEMGFDAWLNYNKSPILFATSEHYDVSYKVQQSARSANINLVEVSMGTREGTELADKLIEQGMTKGSWVLIENIQYSTRWLSQLVSRLESRAPHENFRLFLTCELNSGAIPSEIISLSRVLTIETQPPWKTMLSETFSMLCGDISDAVHLHLLFVLAWFHTTVLERLKYTPLGFKHPYDFNESEVCAAAFVLEQIILDMKKGSFSEQEMPWSELAHRIGGVIYGGKISDSGDSEYCVGLATQLFAPKSLESGFNLTSNPIANELGLKLPLPDASEREEYEAWIRNTSFDDSMVMAGLRREVLDDIQQQEAFTVAERTLQIVQDAVRSS